MFVLHMLLLPLQSSSFFTCIFIEEADTSLVATGSHLILLSAWVCHEEDAADLKSSYIS